jgi:hypothetical protein
MSKFDEMADAILEEQEVLEEANIKKSAKKILNALEDYMIGVVKRMSQTDLSDEEAAELAKKMAVQISKGGDF